MIELKYLCDYQIHVPIFNDDLTNKNICSHILKNYRNIIIYCNSQKEGKQLNKLMNELQLNSSEYIDCNTSKKKRDIIIEKYKNGEIPFLVNVRILVEGFDAPITKGVCFLHLPTNKTTLIQIIGRCLRLHPIKTIANIILPFSSKEDEKNICNFLKVMAKNDSRIKKSFENKTLGGYISIENLEENDDEENEDIEFKYNMIYDSMGILTNRIEIWMKQLDDIKKYIDTYNKRPSSKDNDVKIKKLGIWVTINQRNYKKKDRAMKNEDIYNKWGEFINKYKKYFLSNNEEWYINLKLVENYIDENSKRPSKESNDIFIKKMGNWICDQKKKYIKNKDIMKDETIKKAWIEFTTKYKQYFLSNNEEWFNNLKLVEEYIIKNKKRPINSDKDVKIKQLGGWICNQQTKYKNNEKNMKDETIKKTWEDFITKYEQYFLSNNELWLNNLKQVEEYIVKNNKKPSYNDKIIKSLYTWLGTQQTNYSKNKEIMKAMHHT
jgi:superfamily II DNA/RNA helicase